MQLNIEYVCTHLENVKCVCCSDIGDDFACANLMLHVYSTLI